MHENTKPPINWPTVLFIAGTTGGALAWPFYAYFYGVTIGQIVLAISAFYITGMSITIGYHRLISHRSFKCASWVEAVLLITGSAAWQGSAIEWCTEHVRHHAHIDTEDDPYNRQRGFWYAHIGWLLRKDFRRDEPVPEFLTSDRLVVLQHRYYVPLAIITGFVVPYALCGVGGLLLAGAVRIVAVHHVTWFINSWAHTGNHRPYNTDVSAVDNWFLAFFTFGEGWHNYHHAFPGDYRNGVSRLAFDPTKWVIWALSKVGAAWDLRRISPAVIWRRRVDAVLALEAPMDKRLRSLRRTRASLEKRIRQTELRLQSLCDRVQELRESNTPDPAEIRLKVTALLEELKQVRDDSRLAAVRHAKVLCENLTTYRRLLERLASAEADFAGV